MKKRLLNVLFLFSLLCVGLFVSDVQASIHSNKNMKVGFTSEKSTKRNEFNKFINKMKSFCFDNRCDYEIRQSTIAFDTMITACNAGPSIGCTIWENEVARQTDRTLAACNVEGPTAEVILNETELPRFAILKQTVQRNILEDIRK